MANNLVLIILISTSLSKFLSYANKLRGKSVDRHVESMGLVRENITVAEILKYHDHFFSETLQSKFSGVALGYVTPWNNLGYDVVKTFGKFNIVSPVWLQIRPTSDEDFTVTGTHDIDRNWVTDVRKLGKQSKAKVTPRVLFEGFSVDDYKQLFKRAELRKRLATRLVEALQQYQLDGAVLEVWSQLGGAAGSHLAKLVATVADALRKHGLTSVLVIPPAVYHGDQPGYFSGEDFAVLQNSFDYFSLMTYDYSSAQRPGPNSPTQWIEKCVESLTSAPEQRHKILLGLNLYGYDFTAQGGGAVIGRDFIKLLKSASSVKVQWDASSEEHFFEIKSKDGHKHVVFFPSLQSLYIRLRLAERLGVGISVWELGQGLNYFFDLL